MLIKVLSAKIW